MPSFRTPFPSAFGISTFSTGFGSYRPSSSSSLIRFHSSLRYGFSSSTVIPSTPAAPLLLITLWSAATILPFPTTASIIRSSSGFESSLLAVTLDAPFSYSRGFRPLPSERESGFSAILSASPIVIEIQVSLPLLHVRAFGRVVRPTMPSADFCHPFTSPLDAASSRQGARSPRVLRSHLLANARCICALSFPYRFRTLKIIPLSSRSHASYTVSVRRASALPAASFRSHLAMDTLAVRLTIPPVGLVEVFHLLVRAPCRAHNKKGSGPSARYLTGN